MIVRAWAVVCKNRRVHADNEQRSYAFAAQATADAWLMSASEDCGPHKVIELRGKFPVPAKPKHKQPR